MLLVPHNQLRHFAKTLLNGVIWFSLGLYMCSYTAPMFTEIAQTVGVYGIANKSTTGNVWLPGKIIAIKTMIGINKIPEINGNLSESGGNLLTSLQSDLTGS
jgi:galactitol-specific phosphotransferase system IIC component